MKRIAALILVFLVCGAASGPSLVMAQGDGETCPALVDSALALTADSCAAAGRNEACYGHSQVEWQPQPDAEGLVFEQAGDIVDVAGLASLRTSALDVAAETWGIALLRLQADLPDSLPGQRPLPGQNVTMLLFGDVALADAGGSAPLVDTVEAAATTGVNIRALPMTSAPVLGSLRAGETVSVDGRLADSSWVRVRLAGDEVGWVAAPFLVGDFDLADLPTLSGDSESGEQAGPMQAFTFTTGFGAVPCAAAPPDGLLLQTPTGQRVTLRVNGIRLTLGSTAFLQAEAGGDMVVSVVEGQAALAAFGVAQTVPEGAYATVPLDDDGLASGPPAAPAPYDEAALSALPVGNLDRTIVVAPAWDGEPVAAAEETIAGPDTAETQEPAVSDPLASVGADDPCMVGAGPSNVNLRSGPGTNYPVQGQLGAGQTASPDGQAVGADNMTWWRLADGTWIRSDVVGSAGACPALPVVTDGLPPPPAPPSSGGGTETVRVHIAPDFCEVYGELRPGVRVQLEAGSGCSPTAERRAAVTAANMPGFYVDGVPVGGVFYESEVYGLVSQCYTMETHAYWIATPGTHGFTQDGRLTDGDMTTCLFTVPE